MRSQQSKPLKILGTVLDVASKEVEMLNDKVQILPRLIILVATLVWVAPANAATHVSGYISSDTTWTQAAGPYVVDNGVTVQASAILTIEPGTIVKFSSSNTQLMIQGVLTAIGNPGNEIVFTSLQDDSVGGDTGGDGLTVGAPGQWYSVNVSGSATIWHADFRFGGNGGGLFQRQLYTLYSLPLSDWTGNYWGQQVFPIYCPWAPTSTTVYHLGYQDQPDLSKHPSPGPVNFVEWSLYVSGKWYYCGTDLVKNYQPSQTEFPR
jgi:hypothetical protein